MKNILSRRKLLTASLAGVCCPPCHAQGSQATGLDTYPNKPIRIVVPYAPGAINDVLARAVADRLQIALGQPVIVENRAGAGAVIGTQSVASAAPDGYTLLQIPAAHAINATLVPKLGYDSIKGFSFITLAARSPFLLVASQEFPARSVPELVALAKAKPGHYAFASPGNGSTAHLMGEMLKSMAGIEVLHVPYKGTGPALNDLIGGVVQFTFSTYPGASAAIKAGRVRVLAVTGRTRWPLLPEVPTVAEAGYPSYDATGWWAYAAPAGTPPSIVARLNREINKVLATPALKAGLASEGVEVLGSTPEQLRAHIETEIGTWGKLIRQAGVKAD